MIEKTKDSLHNVYLGLGSNLGNREGHIRHALENINRRIGKLIICSPFYETAPQGFDSDNSFLNGVCLIETRLAPLEVLEYTQVIERELGRKSKSYNKQYADRTIDIDLLMYDDLIIEYPHLILPHPHLHERGFVLLPLADIAAEKIHPLLKKTITELKKELPNLQ